jgi:hypothetical protein
MAESSSLGYKGDLGFWGTDRTGRAKQNWWNQDMSDAGQALYSDPQTGVQTGSMPDGILADYRDAQAYARAARGGFMQQMLQGLGNIDSALSNVPGWGVTKNALKTVWWPVDKLASGAYWLYSEGISQPLSTALLTSADADLTGDWNKLNPFSDESTWGKNYDEAEHISPGQAFMNYENTAEASGQGTMLSGLLAGGADKLDANEQKAVNRNINRFMYDTDYWRDKQGWTYTVGTGAMDFALSMGADPAYAGVSAVSKGVKAARSVKLTTAAAQESKRISGFYKATDALGNAIGSKFAKTPEEASRSTKINGFFDWADGKSAAEIAQHPIWGTGRRANPEKYRLSEYLSKTDRDDMPLFLRFAGGDNNAAVQMTERSQDTLIRLGKLQDNRVLVDSTKFDADALQYFMREEAAGNAAPHAGRGIVGTSAGEEGNQLLEPPFPRPTEPGPRQQGWDKTYGPLAEQSRAKRAAARSILNGMNGVRPMSGAAATSGADILRAQQWKADQLELINKQIGELQGKSEYYSNVLGNVGKAAEDFSPGESNLFGSMTSLYRQGPLSLKSSEKTAEKGIAKMTGAYGQKVSKEDYGFVSRTLRNGFYSPVIRVVSSFGDKIPSTFIDHNAEDAFDRVSEMLRRVPKLDPNVRLNMINQYTNAGDKVSRSKALDEIHSAVIEHMASNVHGLDVGTARLIDGMIKNGTTSTMGKLTGQVPNDAMFSAAKIEDGQSAVRADMVEDGDSYVISPIAKTQLAVGQPLLDVKQLDRLLSRNSGLLSSLKRSGGDLKDSAVAMTDMFNGMWKASTLLRPGYILRSQSDEQAASAVKFGLMSTIIGGTKGGANWALNRGQQLAAEVGMGSYASTTKAGKATVRILDDAALEAATKNPELKVQRVKVSKAWPVVEDRLTREREGIAEMESAIKKEKARRSPDQNLINEMNQRIADHQTTIGEFTDYAHALLREATDATGRRLGEGVIEHRGQKIPQAFSKEWENPIPRDQITSAHAMETIFARSEAVEMNRLMRTGSWTTITPDVENEAHHMESWVNGLNKQFRQDPLFQKVASDPTLKEARNWLRTPDGKYHRSILGPAGRDEQQLITAVKTTLDHYLPPATGLQDRIAKGEEILPADLKGAIDPGSYPVVHGEEFTSLTRHGAIQSGAHAIDRLIEKGFRALGTVPNDVMARQPIYLRAQEARMRQFMDQEIEFRKAAGKGEHLDTDTLNSLLAKSDRAARKDISQVVYDPNRTTATEALRFVAPFMAAHMDGLSRWGGLIAEQPQFLANAAKIYNAPVAANMVTDQSGNIVDQTGHADVYDPTTGEKIGRKFVPLEDRILNLRMPTDTKNARKSTKKAAIPLSSLNTILPGDPWFNPGSGPFVQMAGNEVARHSPAIGDFLQWAKVMPYGPSENRVDPLIPKYMRDAWDAYTAGDAGNNAYQEAYLQEYQRQMGDYHNGGPAPDMKKVAQNAKKFMFLDALTSWAMPVSVKTTPLTGSPYQFFIDQYKSMQQIDPKNAKKNFYKKFGEDYFAFTADLSKSMGVQATLPAQHTAEMYGDLIEQDPDLAPLVVGDVYNQGKFSMSVYRKQMNTLMGGKRMREKISALDAINENKKDLGWQQYNKYANMIDGELIRSGFHSYNQAGAQPLADLKQQMVQLVADGNDAWYEDYGTTSTTKMPIRIKAMERMVKDKRLMSDPFRNDLYGLAAYLGQRSQLQDNLRARGAKALSFSPDGTPYGDNADIGMQLRTLQLFLVNSNLEFADIYHRYLEHDDLS